MLFFSKRDFKLYKQDKISLCLKKINESLV